MNTTDPIHPSVPPLLAPDASLAQAIEALLKRPLQLLSLLQEKGSGRLPVSLACFGVLAMAAYGLVVGSFSGGNQLWAAALKISGGTVASLVICLPSLFVFSCLSGAEVSLRSLLGVLSAILALTALLLIGFVPVAWVFAQSTDSIAFVGGLHLVFWLIALRFGLRLLSRMMELLKVSDSRHLQVWMMMLILVSLQMSTALRPLVGRSETWLPTEKKFFLSHWSEEMFRRGSVSE